MIHHPLPPGRSPYLADMLPFCSTSTEYPYYFGRNTVASSVHEPFFRDDTAKLELV